MAADFLTTDRTKQLGNVLVRAANLTRELRELIDMLNDAANHCVDGSDYSLFEEQFGQEQGVGANAVTLLGYMNEIVNTDTTVSGSDRKSRIDEFCARLAGQ